MPTAKTDKFVTGSSFFASSDSACFPSSRMILPFPVIQGCIFPSRSRSPAAMMANAFPRATAGVIRANNSPTSRCMISPNIWESGTAPADVPPPMMGTEINKVVSEKIFPKRSPAAPPNRIAAKKLPTIQGR